MIATLLYESFPFIAAQLYSLVVDQHILLPLRLASLDDLAVGSNPFLDPGRAIGYSIFVIEVDFLVQHPDRAVRLLVSRVAVYQHMQSVLAQVEAADDIIPEAAGRITNHPDRAPVP